MDEKKEQKKLTMTNTKQEMLQAYNTLLKELEEKQAGELKPEKKIEEKKNKEAVQVAASLTTEGVGKEIAELKLEIGKTLTADRRPVGRGSEPVCRHPQRDQPPRKRSSQELYEIEKAAMSLAALIEAQNQKRQEFTAEMEDQERKSLRQDIETTRTAWEKEQEEHDAAVKERDAAEKKRQTREKEEFDYAFKREQQTRHRPVRLREGETGEGAQGQKGTNGAGTEVRARPPLPKKRRN